MVAVLVALGILLLLVVLFALLTGLAGAAIILLFIVTRGGQGNAYMRKSEEWNAL
jgi:hypothetical protein